MDDDHERLLQGDLLQVPADFTARVMAQLPARRSPGMPRPWRERLQWLALGVSTAAGAVQLASFLTCLWAASSAL